ncbi:MAG: helix-turn-helix domain-containing protein [Armatimonadota bacterium]|nr:helix-turn-helix domain-containing protein [Armatimonadota bacterium]
MTDETYYTVEEAAKCLNMTESAVKVHVREGRLPALRCGEQNCMVRPADLEKLQTLLQGESAMALE